MIFRTGSWTEDELDRMIRQASGFASPGERIAFLSGRFLGVPYQGTTLIGGPQTPENMVIDLGGVDCFTFLDYVEAMRLSSSLQDLPLFLQRVRYHGAVVSYRTRNHFFSDWIVFNDGFVADVTAEIGEGRVARVQMQLNRKADGTLLLEGVEPRPRSISFVPGPLLDEAVVSQLRTGDYVGIYADADGLDVSHVGIIIREGSRVMLRHASAAPDFRKVVDQDLAGYMAGKPGLMVLRPVDGLFRLLPSV